MNRKALRIAHKAVVKRYIGCISKAETCFGTIDYKIIEPMIDQVVEDDIISAIDNIISSKNTPEDKEKALCMMDEVSPFLPKWKKEAFFKYKHPFLGYFTYMFIRA